MSVHPTFPGGNPQKPWDKQPWDKSGESGSSGGEGGTSVAGGVLEGAGCCLDGCASRSIAVLIALFAVGGTARAAFELFK